MNDLPFRSAIRFILNDELIELDTLAPTHTLLDYLRLDKALRGTKEGCAEGDCGACSVLVGRLNDGVLTYETVNACIRFTASLHGCHVVTIEHLKGKDGALHPVQQAMVDYHGSQCGFCTPGIVMSLYALWMNNPRANVSQIEQALQGNLCRCTGYAPIVRAAQSVLGDGGQSDDPLVAERGEITARLDELQDGVRVEISGSQGKIILPGTIDDLAETYLSNPEATFVGGATDVGLWVTKFMRPLPVMIFTAHLEALHTVLEGEDAVSFGAGVTYSEFGPTIMQKFPQLEDFWMRIGGQQVRNMGTIGGNIANGSPIGDTPPVLMALGAALSLRKGTARRFVALEDYFISYGKQIREPGEFIESITIPYLSDEDQFAVYKISKRREEDISTLCGAFNLRLDDENRVSKIIIAFGGMAGVPQRAKAVENALVGQEWNEGRVLAALELFKTDYKPLTDVRGSATYRMLSAQNLLRRFYMFTQGEANELQRSVS